MTATCSSKPLMLLINIQNPHVHSNTHTHPTLSLPLGCICDSSGAHDHFRFSSLVKTVPKGQCFVLFLCHKILWRKGRVACLLCLIKTNRTEVMQWEEVRNLTRKAIQASHQPINQWKMPSQLKKWMQNRLRHCSAAEYPASIAELMKGGRAQYVTNALRVSLL